MTAISVIIPAHNEAAVIGRCLQRLTHGPRPRPLEITVVANGCTDDTARIAAGYPEVRVLELAAASKPAALNAGDAVATEFPRVYLDADTTLSAADLARLADALDADAATTDPATAARDRGSGGRTPPASARRGRTLAVVPRRRLALDGRPLLVRGYYAIHSRLPVFDGSLFGRGAIAVSAAGRARFERFPEVLGDDLFLDAQFTSAEKAEVGQVCSVISAPRRTTDLVRRLTRVRAGNAALRAHDPGRVRPAARTAWLRRVVARRPWLAPAAVCYVGLTVAAALLARRRTTTWGRDESSRVSVR